MSERNKSGKLDHLKVKKPPPAQPVKQPAVTAKDKAEPSVRFACNHVKPISRLVLKKCLGCVVKEINDEQRRGKASRKGKMQQRRAEKLQAHFRLPPNTVKTLRWDGEKWHGVMTLNNPAKQEYTLHLQSEAESEKKCLHGLHRQFAEWLAEHKIDPATLCGNGVDLPAASG